MAASRGLTPGGRVLERRDASGHARRSRGARTRARRAVVRTRAAPDDGRRADPDRPDAGPARRRARHRRRRFEGLRCTELLEERFGVRPSASAVRRRGDAADRGARIARASSPASHCCGASSRPRTRPAGRSSSARWSTGTTGIGSARRSCAEAEAVGDAHVVVVDDASGRSRPPGPTCSASWSTSRRVPLTVVPATGLTPMGMYAELAARREAAPSIRSACHGRPARRVPRAGRRRPAVVVGWMRRAFLEPLDIADDRVDRAAARRRPRGGVCGIRPDARWRAAGSTSRSSGSARTGIWGSTSHRRLGDGTRAVELPPETIAANARYWGDRAGRPGPCGDDRDAPDPGCTPRSCCWSRATSKRDVVRRALEGPVGVDVPRRSSQDVRPSHRDRRPRGVGGAVSAWDLLVVGRPTVDVMFVGAPEWPALGKDIDAEGLGCARARRSTRRRRRTGIGLRVAYVADARQRRVSRLIREEFESEGLPTEFVRSPGPAASRGVGGPEPRRRPGVRLALGRGATDDRALDQRALALAATDRRAPRPPLGR